MHIATIEYNKMSFVGLKQLEHCLIDGQYASYDFMWEVSQSEGSSHSNQASITLIDGSKCYHGDYHLLHNNVMLLLLLGQLLYTAFRKCVIPPPMCSHVLTNPVTMTAAINQVTFSPCLEHMLVMTSMGHALLYCLLQDGALTKDQHGFQLLASCPKLLNSTQ